MTKRLRVALFVEGSHAAPPARGKPALERIWNEHLTQSLGLRTFDRIEPISKKHLVALDPQNPPMSGAGEALDALMARKLATDRFDSAVVAWDLIPRWNQDAELCRWQETLDLYRLMAESTCEGLDRLWKRQARKRHDQLSGRPRPGARTAPPALEPGMILAVCMDPMFESLLVQDGAAVRQALGVAHTPVRGWPGRGWADQTEQRPDDRVLRPAIEAVRQLRPRLDCARQIRGPWRTHKNEWGEYVLRRLVQDEQVRAALVAHPLPGRLAEFLGS